MNTPTPSASRMAALHLCCAGLLSVSTAAFADSVAEGKSFNLQVASPVWYGSGAKFTVKQLAPGNHVCGNGLFGDPNYGVVKMCRSTGFLDVLDCYPSQLGGTGSRAAWGVSLAPVQAWAGWWCGERVQMVACVAEGCKPDVARGVVASITDIMNSQIKTFRTEEIDSARLKAVWASHVAEIDATKGVQ
jgi:hypothetical protein